MSVFQNGKVEIIANEQGNKSTPSYVAFTDSGRLIGADAKNQAATNPSNTIFNTKRLMGRRYDDKVVEEDMKHWPFKVVNCSPRTKMQVEYKGKNHAFTEFQLMLIFWNVF